MAAQPSPARPVFDPLDTASNGRGAAEVESPSVSDSNALARFEFESGRGNEGTKILMVEWEDDESTASEAGGVWHISWEGKKTILPADDSKPGPLHRLYFLLGPGTPIPKNITLTFRSAGEERLPVVWRTVPLPAIFPPELGATAREAGKKGVLHTIWAKKRLQSLQKEMEGEANTNAESVGLAMALQEREWIEQHFGVTARPAAGLARITIPNAAELSNAPLSPGSPGGGRLLGKLKGLKLGTSEKELHKEGVSREANPLSPETGDVAMSSFAAIKGLNPDILAAKPPQAGSINTTRVTAQEPPQSIVALQHQQQRSHGMASLDALSTGKAPPQPGKAAGSGPAINGDDEDELFAVPMSARSPDMAKSPFSFAPQDTLSYLRGERGQTAQ